MIAVQQNGVPALVTSPLYPDGTSATTMSNPFTSADGYVDFYLDTPQRVDLLITAPGQTPVLFPDIDINEAITGALNLTFAGAGANSTQLGASAVASQAQAVALGDTASATQTQATAAGQSASASGVQGSAFGQAASASGAQSTAVGADSSASQAGAVALGADALASAAGSIAIGANTGTSGANSVAVGNGAAASTTGSAAIGPSAVASEDNQIMLGTPGHSVDIPGLLTQLSTPSQIKFRIYLTDAGTVMTRYHYPVDATNLLPAADQLTTTAGIGSWAAGLACTVTADTTWLFGTNTTAMKLNQTAAGPAYAVPAAEAVGAGTWYVGKVWYFRPSGAGSATQYQTWLAFYNSSSVLIGSAVAGPPQTIVNGSWIVADVRAQAPAGAVTAVLQGGVPSGGVSGDHFWMSSAGIFAVPQVI